MGQLTASIAHEVNQPIAVVVTNAQAALCWLNMQPPDLREVRQAVGRIVEDGRRSAEVIGRIRALIANTPPRTDKLEINNTILEVIAMTRAEMHNGARVSTKQTSRYARLCGAGRAVTRSQRTGFTTRIDRAWCQPSNHFHHGPW
jgi:C4-dicarboxylate-specific signal transduction histidine kinase